MNHSPKVAFVTIGDKNLPSTRFRVIQYLPSFQRMGIHVDLFLFNPKMGGNKFLEFLRSLQQGIERWCQLEKLASYNLIIVQKGLTPWRCRGLSKKLFSLNVPFLLDVDDLIFFENPIQFPKYLRWLQDDREPMKLLNNARKVIVGNQYLAEVVQKHGKDTVLIPTCVDTEKYFPLPNRSKTNVTIGWSGSGSTNQYINDLIPVLKELSKKYDFTLLIISSTLKGLHAEKLSGVQWQFIEWRKETEVEDLRKIDIGVMPLPDDEWSRGKCGLKLLLYMALGLPAVCSPVGVNKEIVIDGKNGYLADNNDEWMQKLAYLIKDKNLRATVGSMARKTVEEKYSVKVNVTKLLKAIDKNVLQR